MGRATCHCHSCQKISGGAHTLNLLVPQDRFRVTAGSPKHYTETHESGMKLTVNFCDNCGSTIYKIADHELFRGNAVVQAGALDDPQGLEQAKPELEVYTKYRAPWLPNLDWAMKKPEF